MKKTVFTLFVLLVCVFHNSKAYEYFTIYFTDGTKSEAFYATDVDSICYSKLSLDGITYDDWQVQEIWTVDSVYRYPLTSIASLDFKDVDENKVAEDIDRANAYIAPLYMQCNDVAELSSHLPTINDIEGVENAWVDNQTLFVNIRDYGTLSYIYPPAMKSGGIQFSRQLSQHSRSRKTSAANVHHHVNLGKACIYNQTIKDENPFFDEANNVYAEFCGMCESMGIEYSHYTDLSPSFFNNEIFDYDFVFLITHGEYDSKKNLHWLYTNEELLCVNDENWANHAQAWLNFFKKYRTFSSNKLGIGVHKEIRGGKLCVIYYAMVSEKYIASSSRNFANKGNAIVFNTACQSLKGNEKNMAKAFTEKGAGCYLGYTETNNIGHLGGEDFFIGLLNAQCVNSAKKSIPEENKKQTWVNNKTGEIIPVMLEMYTGNTEANDICFIDPETLGTETESNDGNSTVILKGQIKMLLPGLYNKYQVGFVVAKDKEMKDTVHYVISGVHDRSTCYLTFEKTLDATQLQSNAPYYYRAYMFDGYSYCYGEVKQMSSPQAYYVWDKTNKTATFYYDGMCESRNGEKINGEIVDVPQSAIKVIFDSSFSNYLPRRVSFCDCRKLKEIENLHYLNTSNVTSMGYIAGIFNGMFMGCSALTSLDLSSFDTSKVMNMCGMFMGCSSLKRLDLSSFNTTNVTNMNSMFFGCSSLTSLDLRSFDTSNVTDMMSMFCNCSSLTSLNVSHFNTSNVTNMYGMFMGCSALSSLDVSHFNTSNVTNMYGMFAGCSALTNLNLSSFITSNVTNMYGMFMGCSALTNLDLSGFTNVVDGDGLFAGCCSLTNLDFRSLVLKGANGEGLFNGLKSLKSINLSNANTINATDLGRMFAGCSSLTNLNLSSFNTSNVTNMGSMFSDCNSLTSLNLSSFNTSNVTNMGSMFSDCNSLTSLNLSSFNTSNVTDMTYMFSHCSALKSLNVGSFNTSKVKNTQGMFCSCSSLMSLNLRSFNTSNVLDMAVMFQDCSALISLDLSSFNTSKVTDMGGMFMGCHSLTTIYATGNWNRFSVGFSFKDCKNLVGGKGTKMGDNLYGYDKQGNPLYYYCPSDGSAAHIDGGKDWPGLFTAK